MKRGRIECRVFDTGAGIETFLADRWREISWAAVKERGRFIAALSGGKTPVGFYRHLAGLKGLPWDKTHIFLVDERFVPPSDADSNYRMIRETLLSKIPIAPRNVHPVSTTGLSPEISAEQYEEELKILFGLSTAEIPEFDIILLGVGEDGHTASLFPGSELLKEEKRLAASVRLTPGLHDRITLTLPVLNAARNVFFLVTGKNKTGVLKRLIDEKDRTLPASMVQPVKGSLFLVMDKEARQ